jgi:hypothetical protein
MRRLLKRKRNIDGGKILTRAITASNGRHWSTTE